MSDHRYLFADLNWKDLAGLIGHERFLVLLPVGATESHGPHAPLATDVLISTEVCQRSAMKLHARSCEAYVLPPLSYAVAETAREFPGTISISAELDSAIIFAICLSLIKQGIGGIGIELFQGPPEGADPNVRSMIEGLVFFHRDI